jgi:protein-S-isoprenylcysteine O-methyltransferase Ste14
MLRHGLAILILPFTMVVLVPAWLRGALAAIDTRWAGAALWEWLPRGLGIVLAAGGLAVFGWCVGLFAGEGQGTLAPWDPTENLVASGPYQHVRNPMISGVAMMLAGQALIWGSWLTGLWAMLFILVNHLYFVAWEEPDLERRFGASYRSYKSRVPRWLPRMAAGSPRE